MVRSWQGGDIPQAPADSALQPTRTEVVIADIHSSRDVVEPDEVVFKPTREMRKARALFFAVAKSGKINTKQLTYDIIAAAIPSVRSLRQWWHNELFVEWFINARSYTERIDYLIDLQLDNLEDIITNREGEFTARDQVTAGRQLAEYKKAFLDEDKQAGRGSDDGELVKALAAKMMAAKRLAAAPESDESELNNRPHIVELP